ncbi:MAG: YhbY family RNA-binding protein [Mogibacterium sp.]|jgi:RNA-binding protein|nr:YhbY family RNA-binding protein [Mogibacterium sp.]
MITGKQRSELKKMAQEIKPTVMIGKEEVTPNVIASIDDYLTAHELIKVQIQDGAILDPKETANEIAEELGAEFVQAIGKKFVLYRQAADPAKRKIVLL